ncbi:hypothetical protein [Oceanobacillus polygoni]|uniref:Uncharacterized protein n=1 Tax=Oceanobacillus polygoni TaxID=1235259 RepID=A0A9X1CD60_9BACI|nr:hypothetical protein [Oceanobacillus polygoni]MBP2079479.1 hypothetical protein [Oceanobacillus polygoni]
MKNEQLKAFMNLSALLAVCGIVIVLFSGTIGIAIADSWLATQGSADSFIYEFKMKANTTNFLVIGSIFLGVGLASFFFTYYQVFRMKG